MNRPRTEGGIRLSNIGPEDTDEIESNQEKTNNGSPGLLEFFNKLNATNLDPPVDQNKEDSPSVISTIQDEQPKNT